MTVEFGIEELRARSVQGVQTPPLEPIQKPITPSGISSISSIAPVKPRFSPLLEAPPQNAMFNVIKAHKETERLADKAARLFEADTAQITAHINQLTQEKEDEFLAQAEALKSKDTWSTLSDIAQYVSGIGSVIFGYSIRGVPGLLIGLAGAVGVGIKALKDTHISEAAVAWYTESKELQKKISHDIEMYSFYLQMGLGMAGGAYGWQTGAFHALADTPALEMVRKTAGLTATTSGMMVAAGNVGMAVYDNQISEARAHLKELNAQITTDNQTIYQETRALSKMIEMAEKQGDEVKKAIRNQEIYID